MNKNKIIKFRAWDNINNRFYPQDILDVLPLKVFLASEDIQQFTGLKDKNAREIYEGDILKVIYFEYSPEDKKEDPEGCIDNFTIHQVIWGGDYPAFDLKPFMDCECNGLQYSLQENKVEIIGNIFENPELCS